jgi:hypothetical protein
MNKQELFNKIEAMRDLKHNWDGKDSDPPNELAIKRAGELLPVFESIGLEPFVVYPNVDGGVTFTFHDEDKIDTDQKFGLIELFNDGSIMCSADKNWDDNTVPDVWSVGLYAPITITNALMRIKTKLES